MTLVFFFFLYFNVVIKILIMFIFLDNYIIDFLLVLIKVDFKFCLDFFLFRLLVVVFNYIIFVFLIF